MENKCCTKCGLEKPLTDFYKNSKSKDGVKNHCKSCMNLAKANWKSINLDKQKLYDKNWRLNNPDKKKEADKNWIKNNPDKKKETQNIWAMNNRDKILKSAIKAQAKVRREKPYIIAWRKVLSGSLNRLGKPKEGHTIDLLGYSALELKEHITSLFTEGMTWDNYGEWHIDHIKQINLFQKDEPIGEVNALTNLRPLWASTRVINGIIYEGNLNRPKYY